MSRTFTTHSLPTRVSFRRMIEPRRSLSLRRIYCEVHQCVWPKRSQRDHWSGFPPSFCKPHLPYNDIATFSKFVGCWTSPLRKRTALPDPVDLKLQTHYLTTLYFGGKDYTKSTTVCVFHMWLINKASRSVKRFQSRARWLFFW